MNAKYQSDWKNQNIIKNKNLLSHIKMVKRILTFGNIEVCFITKWYHHESPIFLEGVNIEKVLVSKKILAKKAINTLLVTCIMIIKLSH